MGDQSTGIIASSDEMSTAVLTPKPSGCKRWFLFCTILGSAEPKYLPVHLGAVRVHCNCLFCSSHFGMRFRYRTSDGNSRRDWQFSWVSLFWYDIKIALANRPNDDTYTDYYSHRHSKCMLTAIQIHCYNRFMHFWNLHTTTVVTKTCQSRLELPSLVR